VSYLVESNTPIEVIREWVGHGSDEMVIRYTHLRPQFRKLICSKFPNCLAAKLMFLPPKALLPLGHLL